MSIPRRRKPKKKRYNFLTNEWIKESDEDDDLDYEDDGHYVAPGDCGGYEPEEPE